MGYSISLLEKKISLYLCCVLSLFLIKVFFYNFWDLSLNPSAQMYDTNILQRITEIDIYRSYSIIYWYLINLLRIHCY